MPDFDPFAKSEPFPSLGKLPGLFNHSRLRAPVRVLMNRV